MSRKKTGTKADDYVDPRDWQPSSGADDWKFGLFGLLFWLAPLALLAWIFLL